MSAERSLPPVRNAAELLDRLLIISKADAIASMHVAIEHAQSLLQVSESPVGVPQSKLKILRLIDDFRAAAMTAVELLPEIFPHSDSASFDSTLRRTIADLSRARSDGVEESAMSASSDVMMVIVEMTNWISIALNSAPSLQNSQANHELRKNFLAP